MDLFVFKKYKKKILFLFLVGISYISFNMIDIWSEILFTLKAFHCHKTLWRSGGRR